MYFIKYCFTNLCFQKHLFMNEQIYWVWLSSINGIGTKTFYQILGKFGDLKTAYENYKEIPRLIKLSDKIKSELIKSATPNYLDNLIDLIYKSRVKVLTRLNQNYPKNLIEIDNAPPVLYFKGKIPKNTAHFCGIVGTRNPTRMGAKIARDVAEALAYQGVVIISGMARGIDAAAHLGALASNGKTIAVLACGADMVFPEENFELYNKIAETGTVISEYLPGTAPKSVFFPTRNRIMAGWSDIMVIGEGSYKSGAHISVDWALKFGKSIYVMPFNPNSPVATLPIMLAQNGAAILKDPLSILNNEGWKIEKSDIKHDEILLVKGEENIIYNLLSREPMHTDEISSESGIPVKDLNLLLTVMEISGIIKSDAGGLFYIK